MKKRIPLVIGAVGVVVIASILYAFFRTPEAPSGEIEAVPIQLAATDAPEPTDVPAPTDVPPTDVPEPTEEPMEESTEEVMEEPTEEVVEEPTEEPTEEPVSADPVIYAIVQDRSTATFELGEDLNGESIRVVGTTNQVAGQIAFAAADLSTAQIGVITINARTLATSNDFRNRAIQNRILFTDQYEFIQFEPTAINGLPASIGVGESADFTIVGNLTIRDVTLEETFDASVTYVSESEISGVAVSIVSRDNYDLSIPEVQGVANVSDDVQLTIEFVATPAE